MTHEQRLTPGDRVGPYVVEHRLGAGGMANVYRVRHCRLGTIHALKHVVHPAHRVRRRLWREGELQASVAHPNVVRMHEMLVQDGCPALVLEHVDGPDLEELLAHGPPDLSVVDPIVQDLLAGVAAVHAAGIVHRDLKPANVLLAPISGGWWAKIADFGVAQFRADPNPSARPASLGTPRYMAPEQWRDARSVDRRADVFSVGCILYEMLADRYAFPGQSPEVRVRIETGAHAPLARLRPDLPDALTALVERCLAVDPAARPRDCAVLRHRWIQAVETQDECTLSDVVGLRA